MDIIYGQADITIINAGGDHANVGLPGLQPDSREVQRRSANINGCEPIAQAELSLHTSQRSDLDQLAGYHLGYTGLDISRSLPLTAAAHIHSTANNVEVFYRHLL
jgi:hypothetical protein